MHNAYNTGASKIAVYLLSLETLQNEKPVSASPIFLEFCELLSITGKDCHQIYPEKRKRNQSQQPVRHQSHNSQKDDIFDKLFGDKNIYYALLERNYLALETHLNMLLLKVIRSRYQY